MNNNLNSKNIKINNDVEGEKIMIKSFERFQQDADIEVEAKINLNTKEVMYEYKDETISSNDIWKSPHLGARLRCARQLNWIMRPSKE